MKMGVAFSDIFAGLHAVIGIEAALTDLERESERKCRVVEMAYLFGMSQPEIADTLGVSLPTVERDLRFARAWLKERLAA